jgi:hypothetical protein
MKVLRVAFFIVVFYSCSKEPDLPALSQGRDLKITGAFFQYYSDSTPSDIKRFMVYPISQTDTLFLDTNSSYTSNLILWSGTDTLNTFIKQEGIFYDFFYGVSSADAANFSVDIIDTDAEGLTLGLKSKWIISKTVSDSAQLNITGVFFKEHTKSFGVRSDSLFQTMVHVKLGN